MWEREWQKARLDCCARGAGEAGSRAVSRAGQGALAATGVFVTWNFPGSIQCRISAAALRPQRLMPLPGGGESVMFTYRSCEFSWDRLYKVIIR